MGFLDCDGVDSLQAVTEIRGGGRGDCIFVCFPLRSVRCLDIVQNKM